MKRLAILLLLLFSLLALCVSGVFADDEPPAGFTDVETHWARQDILRAQELGLVNGVTDTEFAPNRPVTRAMFVTVLYRLDGSPAELPEGAEFTDVDPEAWYADAVRWASGNGIVSGMGDGRFAPSGACTREQAVTLLRRYLLYLEHPADERSYLAFADAWQIGDYARLPMQWAVAAGLVKGTAADTITPKGVMTRAQFAALAVRFTDYLAGELPAPEPAAKPGTPEPVETELFVGARSGGKLGKQGLTFYISLNQLAKALDGTVSAVCEKDGIPTVTLTVFQKPVRLSDGFSEARISWTSYDLGAPALCDGEDWQVPTTLFSAVYGYTGFEDRTQNKLRYLSRGKCGTEVRVNGSLLSGVTAIEKVPCVSLRLLADVLGGSLSDRSWDGASTVTLTARGHTLVVHNGSVAALLDGKELLLPQPVYFDSVVWHIPARAALEALGCTVAEDPAANRLDSGTLQKLTTVLWIDGKRFPACYSLLDVAYLRLEDLCALGGGTLTAQDGTLRLSVFGRDCTLAENSCALAVNGKTLTLPLPVFRTADGLFAPVKALAEALGFTETKDTSWNQLFYTKIVRNSDIPKGYSVPVLMYHAVSDSIWGIPELFVSPKNMEAQLKAMLDAGCTPITFEDLDHVDKIKKPVLLTFDDGYRDNYTNLFPLLKKYNVKVTIFMISGSIGSSRSLTEAQIREMSDSGLVSFQSHTVTHNYLDEEGAAQLEREMHDSMWTLMRLTGKQPFVLCYPSGRSSALARQYTAKYYEFGLNMSGSRYVTGTNPYMIYRYYVSRDTSVSTFLSYVR